MEDSKMIDLTTVEDLVDLNEAPPAFDLPSEFLSFPTQERYKRKTDDLQQKKVENYYVRSDQSRLDELADRRTKFERGIPFAEPMDAEVFWDLHRGCDQKWKNPLEVITEDLPCDFKLDCGLKIDDLLQVDKEEVEEEIKKRKEVEVAEEKFTEKFDVKPEKKKQKIENGNTIKMGELVLMRNYLNRNFFGDYLCTEAKKRKYSWLQIRCSCCGFILDVIPFSALIGRKHETYTIYTKGRCVSCEVSKGACSEERREEERRIGKRWFRAFLHKFQTKGKGERIYVVRK